jgi:hypothetical protein
MIRNPAKVITAMIDGNDYAIAILENVFRKGIRGQDSLTVTEHAAVNVEMWHVRVIVAYDGSALEQLFHNALCWRVPSVIHIFLECYTQNQDPSITQSLAVMIQAGSDELHHMVGHALVDLSS